MERPELERIARSLMAAHGCHTAILYGSRARGDATPQSDVDLVLVRETGAGIRDAHLRDGLYIDAFIYPETALAEPDAGLLRIRGGIVLCEQNGFGTALLAKVHALYEKGPPPLPDDQRRAATLWSQKMLERIRGQATVGANYRRMQLAMQALEDYFAFRAAWFHGSKEAFAWLKQNDPDAHRAFDLALRRDSTDTDLENVVERVYGPFRDERD